VSDVRFPRPSVRDDFRKRLRAELMNEAVVLAEARRARRASFAGRFSFLMLRLRPIAVAAGALAIVFAGAGVAAAGSLPGDPAFGLKRAAEEAQVALAPSDGAKAEVLGQIAERRLDELARIADRPDKAPTASAEYEAAVKRFASAVEALRAAPPGAKRDAVEKVVEAAREKHEAVLEELKDRLPDEAKRGLDRATEEHVKIAPPGRREGERSPKPSERARETERPRATETPRGGRPSPTR
jgi:hypothetical protein